MKQRQYAVFYRCVRAPYSSSEPVDAPQPVIETAYSARDAVFQARLRFKHGRAFHESIPFAEIGKDYVITRVCPYNQKTSYGGLYLHDLFRGRK